MCLGDELLLAKFVFMNFLLTELKCVITMFFVSIAIKVLSHFDTF